MKDLTDSIYEASKASQAGKDLWKLLNALADDLADVNWYEIAKHYHEEVTQ